jgi:hypothetical protein
MKMMKTKICQKENRKEYQAEQFQKRKAKEKEYLNKDEVKRDKEYFKKYYKENPNKYVNKFKGADKINSNQILPENFKSNFENLKVKLIIYKKVWNVLLKGEFYTFKQKRKRFEAEIVEKTNSYITLKNEKGIKSTFTINDFFTNTFAVEIKKSKGVQNENN